MAKGQQKKYEKTEFISFPDAIVTRLMRGREGSNVDRIRTIFKVEIRPDSKEGDSFRYKVMGDQENVDLVCELFRMSFYDASLIIKQGKIKDKYEIKKSDFEAFEKALLKFLPSLASRIGQAATINNAIEASAHKAAGVAIAQMRKAIGVVPTNAAAAPKTPRTTAPSVAAKSPLPSPAVPSGRLKGLEIATFEPRNASSALLYTALQDEGNHVAAGIGPAGGSKSITPIFWSFAAIQAGQYERLIILRPRTTTNGESMGAVKGNLEQKQAPYLAAMETNLRIVTSEGIAQLKDRRILSTDTGDTIRGDTLSNAIIMVDEAENYDVGQIKAITTRMGENSRLIYAGDISAHQNDLRMEESGLVYITHHFCARAAASPVMAQGLAMVQFTKQDSAARNPFLPELLEAFDSMPQGYTPIHNGATKAFEEERATAIEANRLSAVEKLKHYSDITEKKYRIAATLAFPALYGGNVHSLPTAKGTKPVARPA